MWAGVLSVSVVCGGVLGFGGVAAASAERAGDAVVVNGRNSGELLNGGGSATSFSLRLPEAASCPGDSANDNYRVQSFIVPVTDDPATLTYGSQGPAGEGRWALYDMTTSPFVNALTEVSGGPGQPGRITPLPQLSFAVFPVGTFTDGRYRVGVACTEWSETVRYWDTEIDVVAAPGDEPAQLRWAVVGAPAPSGVAGLPLLVGVSVLGVVVALVTVALRRRLAATHAPLAAASVNPSSVNHSPSPNQEQP